MTAYETLMRGIARSITTLSDDDAGRLLRYVTADLFGEAYDMAPDPDFPDAGRAVYSALSELVVAARAETGTDVCIDRLG